MSARPSRPNVIYLNSHDTGRLIEPYGFPASAPNLCRIADEGLLFRQAFCAAPTCSASRAALVTGEHPHQNGLIGLVHRGFRLRHLDHHLVHALRPAGYHSVLVGEQHIVPDPTTIGYDRVEAPSSTVAALVAPLAAAIIGGGIPEPFFMSVGFHETHRPFAPASPAVARRVRAPDYLPDTPETREDTAAFAGCVTELDRGVGVVLDALTAAGLSDRTLLMVTTDHGAPFPGSKATLSDRGTGVLLLLRGPPPFTGGRVIDALVQQLDLYPTLCDLAGVPHPPWLQGRSLVPLAGGEVDSVRDEVFLSLTYHAAYDPQRAVRTTRHKYVRRFAEHPGSVLANVDDGPTKDVLVRAGWGDRPQPREALYDVVLDPEEELDVAGDPAYGDALADLSARLSRWMEETGDPLRHGPVPPPADAEANVPGRRTRTRRS